MDNRETVTNVYLRMYPKSYSGEVTFEVRCFDEYLSRLEKIRPSKYLMASDTFSLEWAEEGLFEVITKAGDQVIVRIELDELRRSYGEWLWELRCTFSIVGDDQKLFNVAWNDQGQTNPNEAIERYPVSLEMKQRRGRNDVDDKKNVQVKTKAWGVYL